MSVATMVYDTMRLFISSDHFHLQPTEATQTLIIDRVSRELSIVEGSAVDIPAAAVSKNIFGILGIVKLISGPNLVVITDRTLVGEINGHLIWAINKTEVFPYAKSVFHLNSRQQQDNRTYELLLKTALDTKGLYYSTSYDLTHTLQRLYNTSSDFSSISLAERADQRFVWNHNLLRELKQQSELALYTLPVVCGFIAIKPVSMRGHNFNYVLISRRSVFWAGTRYNIRGLDSDGHAANFVETEQLIEYDYSKCSFVQTRGSIPLKWSQKVNLKYKPRPKIYDVDHQKYFADHFNGQIYNYGGQVLVNLVNLTGTEGRLAYEMEQQVRKAANRNINYEAFDFHKECGQNNWSRLSILMARLENYQEGFGYFSINRSGSEVSQQKGVFRVNCIDCLDRTNVVEGLLAKRSLKQQLVRLGILLESDTIEAQSAFDYVFRNVWADNADYISMQYAGTGALKTDFTRTGKRTTLGLLKDGWNSMVRYYRNNFSDGFRQDSIDLFLGNYLVDEQEGTVKTSPLNVDRDFKFYILPVVFLVAISMFTFTVLLPSEAWAEQIGSVLFWGGAAVSSLVTIYAYGSDFVDVPKLTQST
ncbi:phosphatidylinositol-3-phosphatase SAC1-like isoform X2 [Watersipora subatra]|uniref:phosphatidylinositol-3-phosphatase SAC1-like isoform X2 n=1 Tax=Watersipora subatra TaxID=2589382 RepID=UPI00355BB094